MSTKYAFTKSLKEVRFLFCQTGEHSAATRYVSMSRGNRETAKQLDELGPDERLSPAVSWSFLTRAYPTMKKFNPTTPIMLREAAGTLPKVYARYEFGREKSQSLEGLSDKQIEEAVTTLVKNDA